MQSRFIIFAVMLGVSFCKAPSIAQQAATIAPILVTQPVPCDTDDPAIWIHPSSLEKSLILGTDKGDDGVDGGLYVFNLAGEILRDKSVTGLKRPNNVDIAYQFPLPTGLVDIAVCTERDTNCLRVFTVPAMQAIDDGGIPVFEGETLRSPMGVSLYRRSADEFYAIVSRKDGPTDGRYLWQYRLQCDSKGVVHGSLVRKFGQYSGRKEIESVAVDSELGYVYYSDETIGVRKYYADPSKGDQELVLFANEGFTRDHEGISIFASSPTEGFIIVSDQQANFFHIFSRSGTPDNPHLHKALRTVHLQTIESDGNDVTPVALNEKFPQGLFVAMSGDKTFHFYSWADLAP